MAREYKDVVVGLDIGTAKVMAVVAEVLPNGELKLAGLGVAPSNGLKRGVVVNIDATVQSIQQALKEAELMADCKIQRVYTGITGSHIRGLNSSGMVAVKDKEVTSADVARVVETAKAINISSDQRLLLVEPQEFVIDGQDVKEPIGMSGIRLEAKIHIVTGAQSAAENIIKCVRRCGLEVEQLMLNPLASSQAVLTDDERELGVVVVDIGAGTTDVAIFTGGAIRHTAVRTSGPTSRTDRQVASTSSSPATTHAPSRPPTSTTPCTKAGSGSTSVPCIAAATHRAAVGSGVRTRIRRPQC